MRPTPRKQLPGYLADALINARNFADRARVPESVPLIGGQGLGSMFLGQAPEELNELSYGNSPIQINPYAGRTGSYVPEMKRGRGLQVFDALSLLPLPGARTVAGGLFGGGLTPGVDAAATVYHGSRGAGQGSSNDVINTFIDNSEYENPKYIQPPHEVRDIKKLQKLTESMQKNGWQGRPILAYDVGRGAEALTGSHRIAAAKAAGIKEIPVMYVDADVANYLDKNGKSIEDASFLSEKQLQKWLSNFGDKNAANLLKFERSEQVAAPSYRDPFGNTIDETIR